MTQNTRLRPRRTLSVLAVSASLFGMSSLPAHAMPSTARPGGVSPIINTKGTGDYSIRAEAAEWSATATISVSYRAYKSSSSNGPWTNFHSDSHSCVMRITYCATPSTEGSYKGYIKVVATASGAGGTAENAPATLVKKVG